LACAGGAHHAGSRQGASPRVTRTGAPPAAGMRHNCSEPERRDTNKISVPSGENTGDMSTPGSCVSRTGSPAAFASHKSLLPSMSSAKTSVLPSGDQLGELARYGPASHGVDAEPSAASTVTLYTPCCGSNCATAIWRPSGDHAGWSCLSG